MFKSIYIEITNKCNLNCSFCSKYKREKDTLSSKEFEQILKKINNYTDYIYLHVLGEPLLHEELDEILYLASKYNKKVNITTNGTLLSNKLDIILKHSKTIRQINISIHDIIHIYKNFNTIDNNANEIINNSDFIISYRLWNLGSNNSSSKFITYLSKKYHIDYEELNQKINIKIKKNLYLNKDYVFKWPSLDNNYYSEKGKCYGTINHIAILSNGNVVPCCLDSQGIINLGNIFETSLENIIQSERFKKMHQNFKKGIKCETLCKKCNFSEIRLKKSKYKKEIQSSNID